jgi:protein-S-isoprenylcysteine O-methyltransferase Ste14
MMTLACLWIAWCTLHSLLISRQAHHFFDRILSRSSGIYRIIYVAFSVVSLIPVLWYQFSLPQHLIMQPGIPVRIIQGTLLIYAVAMFYLGGRMYDMHYFLGITQWQNAKKNKPTVALPFHMDGVLAYVRHPWYSGGIALLWGFGTITDVYLLTRIILTGYFIIGTWLEEKRLKVELGEQYVAYCRKVPMLIPWKGIVGS